MQYLISLILGLFGLKNDKPVYTIQMGLDVEAGQRYIYYKDQNIYTIVLISLLHSNPNYVLIHYTKDNVLIYSREINDFLAVVDGVKQFELLE